MKTDELERAIAEVNELMRTNIDDKTYNRLHFIRIKLLQHKQVCLLEASYRSVLKAVKYSITYDKPKESVLNVIESYLKLTRENKDDR